MGNIKIRAALFIALIGYQPFSATAQMPEGNRGKIKEQFDKISIGANVEAKLQNGGGMVRGEVVSITNESFDVLVMKSGKSFPQTIMLNEVISLKLVKPKGIGTKVTKGLLAMGGVAFLVFEIWATLSN